MKFTLFNNAKIAPEIKGLYGEWSIDKGISAAQESGYTGRMLHNVYVPKSQSEYTEIDVLYITKKGIIVFESKNYQGWIFGDGESKYWTCTIPSGKKYQFYNPILQNKGHIKHLSKLVPENTPLFSVIAYSENCEIKKMSKVPNDTYMVRYSNIPLVMQRIWNLYPDVLSDSQVINLFDYLAKLRTADLNVINAHIQSVRNYSSDFPSKTHNNYKKP